MRLFCLILKIERTSGGMSDNDFFSFVESIRKEPLFEMCERIVSYFSDEGADEGERVYIQAFQDYVLDYCRTHTAELGFVLVVVGR